MNFYYIFKLLYVVLILALIFGTSIKAFVAKNYNGKTTDHVNLLSRPVKDLNKYEANVRRPQRQFLNEILSKDNYDNMAYSDADYNLDSNENGSEENEKWFQEKLKHSSTQNQQSQELSNLLTYLKKSKQELSLFDGNDDEDDEDNGEDLKEKYLNVHGGTSLRSSNGKSNPNNSRAEKGNTNSMNYNLTNSKNQSQQASSDHNLSKAKYSTDSRQIADCISTDLSGCHQCSQPQQQQIGYSRSRDKNFFEKISDTSNEDKNFMGVNSCNMHSKVQASPHLSKNQKFFGTNKSVQLKQIDAENNGDVDLALLKFSVAAREKYNWEYQPFNGQLANTKNTLAHEADYKLSKVEQDNSEKRKDSSWKENIFKRSHEFNPMHEIELKTSNRLMKKGFGASLPSSLLGVLQPDYLLEFMENNERVHDQIFKDDFKGYNKNFAEYDPKRRKTINKENERYRREKKSNEKNIINVGNHCSDGNEPLKGPESKIEEKNCKDFSNLKALKDTETGKVYLKDLDFKASELGSNPYVKTRQNPDQLNKENFELANIQELQKALDISQEGNRMEDNLNAFKESSNNLSNFRRKRSISSEADLTYEALKDSNLNYRKCNNFDIEIVCKDKLQKSPKQLRGKNCEINDFQEPSKALDISTERYKMLDKVKNYSDNLFLSSLHRGKRSFNMSHIKFKYAKIAELPEYFNSSKLGTRTKSFLNLSDGSTDYPLTSQGNSLTKDSALKTFTKLCLKKALKIPKHIKAFLKKTVKFLRFGVTEVNMNQTNKSEDEELKTLESKTKISFKVSKDFPTNLTAKKTNSEKSLNKNFLEYDKNFNYNYKIRPKLRLFKEGLHNLFNYSKLLKSFYDLKYNDNVKTRSQRVARILNKFENKYNKKQDLVELESLNKKLYQVKGNTESLRSANEKFSEPVNKQIKKISFNANIKEASDDKYNRKKLRLNESLAENKSSVENFKTKISNNDCNKNNLKSKTKFEKILKAKHTTKNYSHYDSNSSKFVGKRTKRSLDTLFLENDIQADTVKRPIRKSFLSYFKDLNRPKPNLYYPSDEQYKSDFALYSNDDQLKKFGLEHKMPHKKLKEELDNLKIPDTSKFYNPINRIKNSISKPIKENKVTRQQNHYESPQKVAKIQLKNKNLGGISKMKSKDLVKMKPASMLETNMLQDVGYTNNSPMVETLKSQYLNDLNNFNQNYKFNENPTEVSMPYLRSSSDYKNNTTDKTDDSQQLSLALRNEILNCQAFDSLQDFLKSLSQNITHPGLTNATSSGEIHMVVSAVNGTQTTISSITDPSMSLDYTTIEGSNTKTSEIYYETSTYAYSELTEEPKGYTTQFSVDNCEIPTNTKTVTDPKDECLFENTTESKEVKLNISIKAKVHGNPLDKDFYGNGTVHVLPGLTDDRIRRDILLHPLDELQERIYDQISTVRPDYIEDSEDINILASGKLSANVVQAIFNTVQTDPTLKFLLPSLKFLEKEGKSTNPNFYAIRNQDNEEEIHHAENLFAQAMDAINSIIEEQARSHTCMPLRPDLQEFYNLILQSRKEQDLIRAKRDMSKKIKSNNFSQDVRQRNLSEIEEDTKIVKRLLKEYESLPVQDRKQETTLRDELLKNLMVLRQLSKNEEKHSRELRERDTHILGKAAKVLQRGSVKNMRKYSFIQI